MKSTLVLVAAASVAYAQYFPGEPDCAVPCLTSAITAAGCQLSDIPCQCGPTQAAIAAAGAGCLLSKCSPSEVAQAQSAGLAVCSSLSAGILTIPSTTASNSATITSAPSSSATSNTAGTLTSSVNTSVNVSESVTVSGKTLSETVVTPTVSTPSITAATSKPVSTNAAPTPAAAAKMVGGLLAGVLGVVAAL